MRSRFFISTALLLSLAAPSVPATAWADKPTTSKADAKEAARLKKEADSFMVQEHYIEALALYQKSYDLSGDPAILYNQGRALETLAEYPDAVDKLEKFKKDASPALLKKVPALDELINDLKSRIVTVIVTSNVKGARVLLREKAQGTVDGEMKLRTRAGPATIEVSADGYEGFKKDVNLVKGETVKVAAQLKLKITDATLVIRSKPISDISLDGKPIGRVPLEFHVAPGSHELVADAAGFESESVQMSLALGDRRELDIELHKAPSITSRWWFWTAIAGVVVTGAAIGAYVALTTERSPGSGSFGDGHIPAGN